MSLAAATRPRKHDAASVPAPPDPAALLAWYDRSHRALPWRAEHGEAADPYRVWLSEIMLQQTTVKAVAPYFARFLERWPDVHALAAAPLDHVLQVWAGLGYYARARNLHACARMVVADHAGRFPDSEVELRALPGVGAYTAAAIAAIAFGRPATPVDGNVERVVARLFAVETELPAGKPEIRALAAGLTPPSRAGDFAQAMMDLGATLCTPKRPACALCPWQSSCVAFSRDDPASFPRKRAKVEGRLRRGAAFWVVREDGCALIATRPERGLLGGMAEVPGTAWSAAFDAEAALANAPKIGGAGQVPWRLLPGVVNHVFTHFPLELVVYAASAPLQAEPPSGMRWVALSKLAAEALPSVMRKVIAHATERPGGD